MNLSYNRLKNAWDDFFCFTIGKYIKKGKTNYDKVLINIGCGSSYDPRYINVDVKEGWHIDYVSNIKDCHNIFPKDYADLIYISHILEHVSYKQLPKVLKDLYNMLKAGGILRISVPDFDKIFDVYKDEHSIEKIVPPLMGGQSEEGDYHHSIFNMGYLMDLLEKAGFKEVRKWDPKNAEYHSFIDCSGGEISLNLEAVK